MQKKLLTIYIICSMFFLFSCSNIDLINTQYENQGVMLQKTNSVFADVNMEQSQREYEVNLYYKYENQAMLVAEERPIYVKSDEIPELAMIRELFKEPKTGNGKLVSPFPEGLQIINAVPLLDNKILAITLSEHFLLKNQKEMDKTGYIELEKQKRELMLNSIAATITDSFPYLGIQIFIKPFDASANIKRLDNSFILLNNTDNMSPIVRGEKYISTPKYTCNMFVDAWQRLDYDVIQLFIFSENNLLKSDIINMAQACKKIISYEVSSGSFTEFGLKAVVSLTLNMENDPNPIVFPLKLVNDNGVWKVDLLSLTKLCSFIN